MFVPDDGHIGRNKMVPCFECSVLSQYLIYNCVYFLIGVFNPVAAYIKKNNFYINLLD